MHSAKGQPVNSGISDLHPEATDRFGHVEVRGIDYIPPDERHGKPRDLFWVWTASNVSYIYLLLGGLLTLFGLSLWQALAVVVVGNLFWAANGLMAVSGPASGSPTSVIMRSMYGVRGNRINAGLFNWPIFIAYEAINIAAASLAAYALLDRMGVTLSGPIKVMGLLVIAVATLVISVYGHATILRLSVPLTALLAVAMVVLGGFVLANTNWGYVPDPAYAPSGAALWGTMMAGVAIIASAPLGWGISADYARYLPADVHKPAVAMWTAFGGFVPAVLLGAVGVLAGSVIDMSDPQTNFAQILPAWFYSVFLVLVILGTMTGNVLTMYSSGLFLQAVGLRIRRSVSVAFDGLLGILLACYALFISDFLDAVSNFLQMSVALLGSMTAIYCVDLLMRRNRYDGIELHDESPMSRLWFTGGYSVAGLVALVVGTAAAALCLNTTLYVGPVATWLNGADLSVVVGPVVATVIYVVLVKFMYPSHFQPAVGRGIERAGAATPSMLPLEQQENA